MREKRGRVWNITLGGSVPKAEIPRQVLIGHNDTQHTHALTYVHKVTHHRLVQDAWPVTMTRLKGVASETSTESDHGSFNH